MSIEALASELKRKKRLRKTESEAAKLGDIECWKKSSFGKVVEIGKRVLTVLTLVRTRKGNAELKAILGDAEYLQGLAVFLFVDACEVKIVSAEYGNKLDLYTVKQCKHGK